MRNNTNYMESGVLSALQLVAAMPDTVLENFYKKSLDGLNAGSAKPPYAYIIPAGQDAARVAFVVDTLRLQGIEVGTATSAISYGGHNFPTGSLVIKLDQPYGRLAKTLLKVQSNFPDENLTTYDDAAWTMGLMTHTDIVEVADKGVLAAPTRPLDIYTLQGSVAAAGAGGFGIADNGSINLAVLRYRLKDVAMLVAEKSFNIGKTKLPAGSLLIPAEAAGELRPAAQSLGLVAIAAPAHIGVPTHALGLPRVAVYSTWGSTQNVGWVRYAFDRFGTSYDLLYKDEVRAGGLNAKYDVIILPAQGRSAKDIVFDLPMKGKPLPYQPTAAYPTLGQYGASPDIRGGMGLEGLAELRKFVEGGGTLITTGNASAVPAAFGLVDDVDTAAVTRNFYAPGPVVKAQVLASASPIFYGYPDATMPVRWATDTLFTVRPTEKQAVLMEFPGGKASVMSGFMKGADEVKNRAAIISLPVGRGRVLMFATNPVWRWQNLGEYRMLYNAMLNWRQLGGPNGQAPAQPDPGLPPGAAPVVDDGSKATGQ